MNRPPDMDDAARGEDVDSEPRRRWKPNAELLRALADARKDLKPGESSLFWDWTATRESAPEAEDVRPSGEGEVFVHEKDAAAAYIAPVQVAPAVPPRQCTKSRIRVREDVDPRRQPTVRTARSSGECVAPRTGHDGRRAFACGADASRPVATFRDASDTPPPPAGDGRASSPSWSGVHAGDRPAFMPMEGSGAAPGPDRRRRVALAIFVGVLSGTLAFFWLRASPEKTGTVASIGAVPTCSGTSDAAPDSASSSAAHDSASSSVAPDSGAPAVVVPSPSGDSGASPREVRHAGVAHDTRQSAPHAALPGTAPTALPSQEGGGFLIRKKGSN